MTDLENSAGQRFGDVFPVPAVHGRRNPDPGRRRGPGGGGRGVCCLPHVAAQGPVAARRAGAGDRPERGLPDPRRAAYEAWYGHPHMEPEALAEAVYGLPELHREESARRTWSQIRAATRRASSWDWRRWRWRAGSGDRDRGHKSGVSGAGRGLSLKSHFVEANENMTRTASGEPTGTWRKWNRSLDSWSTRPAAAAAHPDRLLPAPAPRHRGILSTIYVNLPAGVSEAQYARRTSKPIRAAVRPPAQAGPGRNAEPRGPYDFLRHRADVRGGDEYADRDGRDRN